MRWLLYKKQKEEKLRQALYGPDNVQYTFAPHTNSKKNKSFEVSSTTRSHSRKSGVSQTNKITFCDFLKRNNIVNKSSFQERRNEEMV